VDGLSDAGHPACRPHAACASIVGGQRQIKAAEFIEQSAQIARTTTHVLARVQDVAHAQDTGAGGHELCEARRALWADGDWIVSTFLDDEGVE
jgi:hypothetical protein